uniref:Putative pancreatic lipase-like enzyme n=1 Tax=Ixodes ricinus TaxID=34613 RepID=V5GZ53_IXORI
MPNFIPLILAVSGAFLFDQGHSSYQDICESSGIVVRTPVNIEDDKSASPSRGGYLATKYSNLDLDINSEAIRFRDRMNRTKRSLGDMGALFEVYTNRKRNGVSDYYSPAVIVRDVDEIPSIAPLLDPNQKLYLLVHGWRGSWASFGSIFGFSSSSEPIMDEEMKQIKNELLRVENTTVIVVDWTEKAKGTYSDAKQYAKHIAYSIAWLVKTLVEAGALNVSKVHYIGHSLGAQAAGYFAKELKLIMNGQKIGRITGLDPAAKKFKKEHLNTDHADFVDVIHTSTGILKLGVREPIGHVDFYPNGGGHQPGCDYIGCSHKRAKIYYLNSIQRCAYPSRCCPSGYYIFLQLVRCSRWQPSCGRMGHHASSDLRGVHYLAINSNYPHCGS